MRRSFLLPWAASGRYVAAAHDSVPFIDDCGLTRCLSIVWLLQEHGGLVPAPLNLTS
jgi:hypothetical protein